MIFIQKKLEKRCVTKYDIKINRTVETSPNILLLSIREESMRFHFAENKEWLRSHFEGFFVLQK